MEDRRQETPREREERQRERADRFWEAFRFTENGKPKSSLGIYTFSLSVLFAAVYALCYEGGISLMTEPLAGLPAWASNLIIALISSAAGTALCCLPHRFFRDRRLVFGGHLWLCGYAAAILIVMLALMGFTEAFKSFLVFFGWTILLPVCAGTAVSAALFRRGTGQEKAPEAPEWKKYVQR